MKTDENKGISASEMNVTDLKKLAVQLGCYTATEVKKLDRDTVLKAVNKKEKQMVKDTQAAPSAGLKRAPRNEDTEVEVSAEDVDLHEGKKVVSRTPIELNGKNYTDILVETGETYRELAQ